MRNTGLWALFKQTYFAVQDADRVESGKAATLAAGVGGLASLPYTAYLAGSIESALLSIAGVVVSCALFGVVYRYARRDNTLDNHLKVSPPACPDSLSLHTVAIHPCTLVEADR